VSATLLAPLAFQVWDGVGWAGQAVFTWRVLEQWIASERAKRTVVPPSFWTWSLIGTALLLVYVLHRQDPPFLVALLVNGFIYGRNLRFSMRSPGAPPRGSPLVPVLLGVLVFGLVAAYATLRQHPIVRFDDAPVAGKSVGDPSPIWLAVGFLGALLWSSRFVVQWWASERQGRSVMPESFFWVSLGGSVLLFTYALHRVDWVLMAAYALNPIPYARNIVLARRHRAASTPG
jgi:lipid-A-disaccharide synthase-like uncharacterized protein